MSTKQTQTELDKLNKDLMTRGENIKNSTLNINNSHLNIQREKELIKTNSETLLKGVLDIVKTDYTELDILNPTYAGVNHAYVKISSLLSEIDEITKPTEKIIKSINHALLTNKKVNFSLFVEKLNDLDTFKKYELHLLPADLVTHDIFMTKVEKVSTVANFIANYNNSEKYTPKELRTALSKIKVSDYVKSLCKDEDTFNAIIKKFKIMEDAKATLELYTAIKEAYKLIS